MTETILYFLDLLFEGLEMFARFLGEGMINHSYGVASLLLAIMLTGFAIGVIGLIYTSIRDFVKHYKESAMNRKEEKMFKTENN